MATHSAYIPPALVRHGNAVRRTLGSGGTSLDPGVGNKEETATGDTGGVSTGQHSPD
jgi:hypothetical protein